MNLHYQFWVDYYKEFENTSELSKEYIEGKNYALVSSAWGDSGAAIPIPEGTQTLAFKVLYPGLLMGLGYEHSTDLVKDAPKIALGMSLDYTTGLPCKRKNSPNYPKKKYTISKWIFSGTHIPTIRISNLPKKPRKGRARTLSLTLSPSGGTKTVI